MTHYSSYNIVSLLCFVFIILLMVSFTLLPRVVLAKESNVFDSSFSEEVRDRKWSYNNMKEKLNRKKRSFFYAGFAFSVAGEAFSVNTAKSGGIISDGFISQNPLLGMTFRFGYEFSGAIGYLASEIYSWAFFSTNPNGLIGSMASGESISLDQLGKGTVSLGVNLKPGFSINNNKGAIYAIIGTGYQFLNGIYEDSAGSATPFNMSGFALNYGLGAKYSVHSFIMLFLDFVAIAPIRGNGAFGLDRTAFHGNSPVADIIASENYSINVGLDFRV